MIEPVLRRRRCLLQAPGTDTTTRDIARVVLATLLHKYGMRADDVTAAALAAVDDLDDAAPPTVRQLAGRPAASTRAASPGTGTPGNRCTPRRKSIFAVVDIRRYGHYGF
ncbi:hypothetical protein [Planobispora longispora]|uniref:hypothetical protein n=2 Tax=Planobispora longispora TaxID=28887 RepID=UPI0035E5C12C